MQINKSSIWQTLEDHHQQLQGQSILELFSQNPNRFEAFSIEACDLLVDYSKQLVTPETLKHLLSLAEYCDLPSKMTDLFSGAVVNRTENRPALHMKLRAQNPESDIQQVLDKMGRLVSNIHSGQYTGVKGDSITDVISLGIGGSDLGPLMACTALEAYRQSNLNVHFISNVDGQSLEALLSRVRPETTICLVNSKTFTTIETLENAKHVKAWFEQALGAKACGKHLIGVTANVEKAVEFGILPEQIFDFWEWVGGRYSIWSAVGLPIALMIGMTHFQSFLQGAFEMDQHFQEAPLEKNLPVIMALLGIWNINFCRRESLAIMPYCDGLKYFPDYLQQLEMESNGKSAGANLDYVDYQTAPVIWGGVGCNGQHAYMQLLHQGTQVIPVDFLLPVKTSTSLKQHQALLVASCLGQAQALMQGRREDELRKNNDELLTKARMCPGSRPSTTIMFPEMSPGALGSLIALYEHKVFVQGVIWQIQSFDQWGVELGKQLIKDILPLFHSEVVPNVDSSTAGLLNYFKKHSL